MTTKSRELLNAGGKWTDNTARLMIPILAERAASGETISYGEMDAVLVREHGRHRVHAAAYGYPAGKVGDIISLASSELGESVPPLNAVLVNKQTHLPGTGADYYLSRFVSPHRKGKIQEDEHEALARAVLDKALNYAGWERVVRHLGLKMPMPVKTAEHTAIEPPPQPPRGSGGEDEAHKRLKEWVALHPSKFREYGAVEKGTQEAFLYSGDRIDVLFADERIWLGVEVKPKGCGEADHWRGVFQCVKYRATLRAMRAIRADIPNVRVLLVVDDEPTKRIRAAAKLLDIEWTNVASLR